MLSPDNDHDEIRHAVHDELEEIEEMSYHHGSYHFLCCTDSGLVCLAHKPFGHILRRFP